MGFNSSAVPLFYKLQKKNNIRWDFVLRGKNSSTVPQFLNSKTSFIITYKHGLMINEQLFTAVLQFRDSAVQIVKWYITTVYNIYAVPRFCSSTILQTENIIGTPPLVKVPDSAMLHDKHMYLIFPYICIFNSAIINAEKTHFSLKLTHRACNMSLYRFFGMLNQLHLLDLSLDPPIDFQMTLCDL